MKFKFRFLVFTTMIAMSMLFTVTSCEKAGTEELAVSSELNSNKAESSLTQPVFMVIDEESIDNGNQPNNFSETDVNDQLARIGLRNELAFFKNNIGKIITLYSGEVGDEGWHALKTIPGSWKSAGPTTNGTRNFLLAGPGLGGGNDPEKLLDKVPDVTPLRATALKMLIGKTILAVVYDSDVSINYDPLNGSLKGENLGLVAFDVLEVTKRTDGSSGSLPAVKIQIRSVTDVAGATLQLFSNAPVPRSSSEPFDINPPANAPVPVFINAE